jgi:hypothetical protein
VISGGVESFVLWSARFLDLFDQRYGSAGDAADAVDAGGASGLALDLAGAGPPTVERTRLLLDFVGELQARGRNVALHDVPGDWATAFHLDGVAGRVTSADGLSECVGLLREFDVMRRACTSDRGRRVNQLRLPSHPLSLAPLCAHARVRLERAGVPEDVVRELLRETHRGLLEGLDEADDPPGPVALSVAVHDGRATVTLLDSGPPRENEVVVPGRGAGVDRLHRFRILDRHNVLVLERDLAGRAASGSPEGVLRPESVAPGAGDGAGAVAGKGSGPVS